MKKIVFIKTIALAAVSLAAQAAVAQDIKVSRSGDTTVVVIESEEISHPPSGGRQGRGTGVARHRLSG